MQAAFRDVEFDHIPVLNQRQCAAGSGFRGGVQDDGAVGRAAHPRIRNADHIGDALLQHLRRQRHIADFGHAGIALGTAVFEDHDTGRVDIQIRVFDAYV